MNFKEDSVASFIIIMLLCAFAFCAGCAVTQYNLRNEAVKANAAHWEPNQNGSPKFVWGGGK